MNRLSARTCRKLTHTISRRLPERYRRDDSGLTTLEWLLIVAAVAGLAALAVVLVTNVVGDTSEQIAGRSARYTAAEVAAQSIEDDPDLTESEKQKRCNRLEITFLDAAENGIDATYTQNTANDPADDTCSVAPKS